MFARLGPWCHDRRKLVLFLWIAALVVFNVIAGSVGDAYRQDFTLKGFESTDGFKLLEEEFPDGPASPQFGTIVFQAEEDVRDPSVREPMEALFEEVRQLEHVTLVESPYDPGGERQISTQGDAPGTIAVANVYLPEDVDFTAAADVGTQIEEMLPVEGVRVELGGYLFAEFEEPSSELFGLAFAIVILIVAFGSVLAMGLPVAVALFGIGMGSAFVDPREPPDAGTGLRAVPRGHDRSRCRYRLRAADRHPLPGAAPRRPRHPRVGRHRDRHRGSIGGVRRRDGRHLVARHAADGRRVRRRARHHCSRDGRADGARVGDAPARPARLRRRPRSNGRVGAASPPPASSHSAWSGSGSGCRRWPASVSSSLCSRSCSGSSFPRSSERCRTGRRSRAARRSRTDGAA